jgi:PAS domain S-box-containing protein
MDKVMHDRSGSGSTGYSTSIPLRVLIVEDNPRDIELCIQELNKAGFATDADIVDTEEGFAARLQSQVYDLILSDYRMPAWNGLEAFRLLKQSGRDIPFILVTGTLGEEAAVDLIKEGVADYILKERLVRLPSSVRRALQEKATRDERERATRALRESEERVRLLLDSTGEAIYGINLEGNCIFCNPACVRLLGYDNSNNLLGKQMHSLIHHTRADGTPYPIEECPNYLAFREGKSTHLDDEVLWRRDNSSFAAEYWSYPMLQNGKLIGSVVTFVDITERKRAEQELRKSEARVRQLVESNIIGIAISDLTGRLIDANGAFLELVGYTRDDLVSGEMRWDALTPPEYYDSDRRAVEQLRSKGVAAPWEKQFSHKNGSRVPVLIGIATLVAASGDVECVSFVLDIGERKKSEESLRRIAEVVESSHDAIISETLDGIVLSWNLGAQRMYGYSSAEMLGKSLSIIVPPDRQSEFQDILTKIRSGHKIEQLETIRLRKDGQQLSIALTVSPIKDAHGQLVGASVIARDITESKRMEEMFLQAQKMEAVGRLAGGVAHDFNNLLGVIIGYGEIVEGSLNKDNPLRAKVEQITKAGRRAAGLTRQLLAFSRQQIIEPTIVSLNSIVADVQKMLQRLIGEDIELTIVLCPRLASTKADQGQIEQVIMNLAVNSRDAMPDGGTLTIETANVELDERYTLSHPGLVPGSYVMLRVTDTGTGMDAETQKHIFEPFFTTKEQGKGTGLGLATVYGVIKQSGGCISVNSELGQGTIFEIYLEQVHVAPEMEQQTLELDDLCEGTETVLLVEDEESLRTLTRDVLLESNYTILEASDGLEALEIARQHKGPIHLLLTDVVMPRMSGPALAKQLAIQNPEVKVLFMSGYTGNTYKNESVEAASILRKPFTRRDLNQKVREVLENRSKSPVTEI